MKISAPAETRLPKNYALVRDMVHQHGTGRHLTASDVHSFAKQRQPRIGYSTVYRALNRLARLGLVSEVLVPGADVTYYESVAGPHAHFRCAACGRIDDLDYHLPKTAVARIARVHGFEVSDVLVNLTGRCASCREAPRG
jgi:Fur family ferric uptake transcriptional regulator